MSAPHPADWTYTGTYRVSRDPKEREHYEALGQALREAIALPDANVDILIDMNVDGYRVRASVMMIAIDTLDLTGITSEADIRAKVTELGPKMRGELLAAFRAYAEGATDV